MAKKKKDPEKKAALQAKKEAKADKAAKKRLQKESKQDEDEDNLDDLLQVYRKKDLDVSTTTLETIEGFPAPRANATLTLAEDGYIYLFGGEYFDGVENVVLDDLLRWDVVKQEWKQVITPAPRPGPRCAHSTVYYRNALYVLGGELATADQYHHYRDLWKFDLTTQQWQEVPPKGTTLPSARSGHAAFVWKQYMIVFGGFYEALRDTNWYNDVCVLDLVSEKWMDVPHSKLASRPEPRSACNVGLHGNVALIHGGYSKLKNPSAKSEAKVHTDAWLLHLKPLLQNKPPTWERLSNRQRGNADSNPSNRSGTACATFKDRMLVYGGVVDTEQLHHKLASVFYNDLNAYDMERRTWFPVRVKEQKQNKSRRRRRKTENVEEGQNVEEEQLEDEDKDESDDESSDLEEDSDGEGNPPPSGWDLDMLRSNMFAFIDGDGNIVYEKIEEEKDGYDADVGETRERTVMTGKEESKEQDSDEEEAKGDDTDEEEEDDDECKQDRKTAAASKVVASKPAQVPRAAQSHSQGHVVSSSAVMFVNQETGNPEAVARAEPLPRINASLVVRSNVLYLYGGLLEVGDREVTLDDCWSFDLKKREKWECLWPGTMHKQVWRGATYDDDDSYISTDAGRDDEDEEDDNEESDDDELEDEDTRREAKAAKKAAKREKEKSKRAGLRQEIADLKGKLDLDDVNRTPEMGEVLADFYSRTSSYWNDQAAASLAVDAADSEKLSSKEIKREGFSMASERYDELRPVLERLNDLDLQQAEAEEDRKNRKEKRKGAKDR